MKLRIGFVALFLVLSGCGKGTEQICKETDDLLRQQTGNGFADTGMIGCLNLSPREAEKSLMSLKEKHGKSAVLMTHDEFDKLVRDSSPADLIKILGAPDSVSMMSPPYLAYGAADLDVKQRDVRLRDDLLRRISSEPAGGIYSTIYSEPKTTGLFGMEDRDLVVLYRFDKSPPEKSATYEKHLWQKWFD
jgi:hypothetical protein